MRKKIAICANANVVGGVEEALVQLLRNIDYSRYEVTLYGEYIDLYKQRFPTEVIVRDCCISDRQGITFLLRRQKYGAALRSFWYRIVCFILHRLKKYDMQAYYSMRSYTCIPSLEDKEYDLVVAYTYLVASVVGNTVYRLRGKKKVLWIHGASGHSKQACQKLDDNIYSKFDTVFCCSDAVREYFSRSYPKSGNVSRTFYNLVDTRRILELSEETLPITMKEISILTVGRLSVEKGQQMVPKTTRILLDAGYDIYWYLVGDGPLRTEVEQELEKHCVQDHVILLGAKANPYPYIKNCNIYVQPSFSEGYCTTTREAKIHCKPVVTTDAPGMREQFSSGENGLIVDAMTPESLANGLKLLLDTPNLKEKFTNVLKNENDNNSIELQKLYNLIEG